MNGPATLSIPECKDWGHVWLVNGTDIANLKIDYQDGQIDQMPALDLLTWPGKGNPYIMNLMGIQLPDQDMAPFFDADLDGLYDPWQGDYPIVGEDCPDLVPTLIAWTIYNDILAPTTMQLGPPLGVEVGVTVFAVDFPSVTSVLSETIFTRYNIRNIGQDSLFDVRIGQYLNADIGCSWDDLVGCQPSLNTFYAYNDGPDAKTCPGGVPGYEFDPPVLTVTLLSDQLASFGSWSRNTPDDLNDTISAEKSFENVFHGLWPNGSPITVGGIGEGTSMDTTTFLFSGIPSDPASWAHSNVPEFEEGDRRIFGVVTPFDLAPQQSKIHYAAYSVHRALGLTPVDQVDFALSRLLELISFYNASFKLPLGNPHPCLTDCVWPGDMDANGMCNNLDLLEWGVSLDRTGSPRGQVFTGWLPQDGLAWGKTGYLDPDARHQDANGDGAIDPLDLFALNENFSKTAGEISDWGGMTLTGPEIKLTRIFNPLTSPDELLAPGKKFMLQFDVSEWPVDSIYNLGYSVTYDPAVVSLDPGFNYIPKSSFFVDSSEVFVRSSAGRVNVGITRTDHVNVQFTPFELGKLRFTIKQDAPQDQYPDTTAIVIRYVKAYLADGTLLEIGSNSVHVPFGLATGLDLENESLSGFVISPNPTSGLMSWSSINPTESLELYSLQGQYLNRWIIDAGVSRGEIELPDLPGVYFLVARGQNGTVRRMKVIRQ
ncbi:MAG: T9SS type A sorting domain-containing protein [Saprospiraceae bacterium]|nr:T9SS type A sorting domain-containing protein [Saprospiraceae bacterium]